VISARKPRVVALGGGTGLPIVLRALAGLAQRIAIVNMVDDGRSTGLLRRRYGLPAIGDLRNSLVELASEREFARSMNFRFEYGPLAPHPAGNVLLAAFLLQNGNDVERMIDCFSRVLKLDGMVIPACEHQIQLIGETRNGRIVRGQVNVSHTRGIQRVWVEPEVPATGAALEEIKKADYIVIAPGSLYSSILAVLVTGELGRSVFNSGAKKIWVMNVANERNETFRYRARDYVAALKNHFKDFYVDYLLFSRPPKKFTKPSRLVKLDIEDLKSVSRNLIIGDFVDEYEPEKHDYKKLRRIFKRIFRTEGNS
jgi:uncharacterized cofD-like protein